MPPVSILYLPVNMAGIMPPLFLIPQSCFFSPISDFLPTGLLAAEPRAPALVSHLGAPTLLYKPSGSYCVWCLYKAASSLKNKTHCALNRLERIPGNNSLLKCQRSNHYRACPPEKGGLHITPWNKLVRAGYLRPRFPSLQDCFCVSEVPYDDAHSIRESQSLAHTFKTGKLQNLFLLKQKLSCICLLKCCCGNQKLFHLCRFLTSTKCWGPSKLVWSGELCANNKYAKQKGELAMSFLQGGKPSLYKWGKATGKALACCVTLLAFCWVRQWLRVAHLENKYSDKLSNSSFLAKESSKSQLSLQLMICLVWNCHKGSSFQTLENTYFQFIYLCVCTL